MGLGQNVTDPSGDMLPVPSDCMTCRFGSSEEVLILIEDKESLCKEGPLSRSGVEQGDILPGEDSYLFVTKQRKAFPSFVLNETVPSRKKPTRVLIPKIPV